jgi:hypothetical protein
MQTCSSHSAGSVGEVEDDVTVQDGCLDSTAPELESFVFLSDLRNAKALRAFPLPDIVEFDLEILDTCEEVRVRSTSAVPIEY